jgi:hypothetical protein
MQTQLYLIVLVYTNATAPLQARKGAGTLLGHSQVTVLFKGQLQRCDHNREAMLVKSVDTAILADAETACEIHQDLKKGLSLDA